MRRITMCLWIILFLANTSISKAITNAPLSMIAQAIVNEWQPGDMSDRWFSMMSRLGFSATAISTHYFNSDRSYTEWTIYHLNDGVWNKVLHDGTPKTFEAFPSSFFVIIEGEEEKNVIYTPSFAPVDATGVVRTWDEHLMATNHFQVLPVEDMLKRITVGSDGMPHISTNENGVVSRLWSDTFQSLERMNFDIYSGTNLVHSTLFPTNAAPFATMPTAEEKAAFADWFRICAVTNGFSSTNSVLAVFADDDNDGRTDAFATLPTEPDADGAFRWVFCKNTANGWRFAAGLAHEVTAKTNEFFLFQSTQSDPRFYVHAIVVIRPDSRNPLWPLLPRYSDKREQRPSGVSLADWNPRHGDFVPSYQALLQEFSFRKLERIPVESISLP